MFVFSFFLKYILQYFQCTRTSVIVLLIYLYITEACGNPEPINNGRVVISGRTPGSNATYLCDDHYQLVGNATVVCRLDSQWLGEVPKCKGT